MSPSVMESMGDPAEHSTPVEQEAAAKEAASSQPSSGSPATQGSSDRPQPSSAAGDQQVQLQVPAPSDSVNDNDAQAEEARKKEEASKKQADAQRAVAEHQASRSGWQSSLFQAGQWMFDTAYLAVIVTATMFVADKIQAHYTGVSLFNVAGSYVNSWFSAPSSYISDPTFHDGSRADAAAQAYFQGQEQKATRLQTLAGK